MSIQDLKYKMRNLMLQKLDELAHFCVQFCIRVKFNGKWIRMDEVDYKSLPDDELLKFYSLILAASSQPRG